jgi:hypothetical protein
MMSSHVRDQHGLTQFWKLHRRSSVMTLLELEDGISPIDLGVNICGPAYTWSNPGPKAKVGHHFPMTW